MSELEELKLKVKEAEAALEIAQKALFDYKNNPKNNTFDDMFIAKGFIESELYRLASDDCEGVYNRGNDEYTRRFYVKGELYEGTLSVDYGRHDKTYYFIDDTYFEVERVEEDAE